MMNAEDRMLIQKAEEEVYTCWIFVLLKGIKYMRKVDKDLRQANKNLFRIQKRIITTVEAERDAAFAALRRFVDVWEYNCPPGKTDIAYSMAKAVLRED